jgi:hypothetical protein
MIGLTVLLTDILVGEPLSPRIQSHNWGFIFFLVCFFISIHAISKAPKLLTTMLRGIFRHGYRDSIFAEPVNNEFIIKLLLCLQTFILFFLFLFGYFAYSSESTLDPDFQLSSFLTKAAILIAVFFLFNILAYHLIGNIFFKKEDLQQWNDIFTSSISLSGFVLFFPTLFTFYMTEAYFYCCIFYLMYAIFIAILLVYKIYILFFPHKSLLLYFILYLCAQEIVPLYFLFKGFDYLLIV